MPIFTSLLLLFILLAILPIALRSNGTVRERRDRTRDEERMATGALICEAAARHSFSIELDHSIESIGKLNALISNEWSDQPASNNESQDYLPPDRKQEDDLTFVLGAYFGDVFVRHSDARWRRDDHGLHITFAEAKLTADPLELIERKLHDPENVDLQRESEALIQEVERLRNPVKISQQANGDSDGNNSE